MKTYRFAVIGAGLAGLSTAYYLARSGAGPIIVLEKAPGPGQEASGQNASMICRAAKDPLEARLFAQSADILLGEWRRRLRGLRFNRTGSLFVGSPANLAKALGLRHARSLRAKKMRRREILERFPFLAKSRFEGGRYFTFDGVIDSSSVVRSLAAYLQKRGVRFLFRTTASPRVGTKGLFEFGAKHRFAAHVVVNAAGAWAGEVARSAGAQRIRIVPRRRHLFLMGPLPQKPRGWPIVWNVDRQMYLRPDGDALLISPCDTDAVRPGPARVKQGAERFLRRKLKLCLPALENAPTVRFWAGLRTFSPDGRFVIGWDGKIQNFFWAACLDGHGLVASAAVGRLGAALMTGQKADRALEKAFSPRRFLRSS